MTNEEAIKKLKIMLESVGAVEGVYADTEVIDLSIKALEKQIPKKVIDSFMRGGFICPICHKDVIGSGYYCWNCGQALDWSEEDEK